MQSSQWEQLLVWRTTLKSCAEDWGGWLEPWIAHNDSNHTPSSLDWTNRVVTSSMMAMQGDTKCGHVNVAKDGPPQIGYHHAKLMLAKRQIESQFRPDWLIQIKINTWLWCGDTGRLWLWFFWINVVVLKIKWLVKHLKNCVVFWAMQN